MRRIFALLLVTPLLASCADSVTAVAPSGALRSEEAVPTEGSWPTEANWLTPGDVFTVEEGLLMEGNLFSTQAAPMGSPTSGEVMTFGNADAGQIFPGPPGSHDASWHARDRIIPGTVAINVGQTVTFKIVFGHRVAIYDQGVQPSDIQQTPGPLLLDPNGRLFLQPFPTPQFTLKFMRPGKYLVLCAINSHFFGANMWGWLIVR